jgi:hypothetical protein
VRRNPFGCRGGARSSPITYHLATDPGKIHDLADVEPERLVGLLKLWDQYVIETGVVLL